MDREIGSKIAENIAQQKQEEQELTAFPRVQGLIDIMSTGSKEARKLMLEDFERIPTEQKGEVVEVLTNHEQRGPHIKEILGILKKSGAIED